jgi:SAM-dependent methyltransferase
MPSMEEIWRRYDAIESRLSAPLSERMLDLLDLRAGQRVLDLASGRGEPAIRAGRRVAPGGFVLGIEQSAAMVGMANERAASEGVANLAFRVADAERVTDLEPASFDAATTRWGLMYMTDPVAALVNVRRALRANGALVAALWAEPERVPYYTLPRRLLERHRSLPPDDPESPGTFRFGDLARITRDFEAAGFALDHVEEMEIPVFEAERVADVMAWVRALGPDRWLADLREDAQRAWERDLTTELSRRRRDGLIQLGGVTRLVRARPVG